MSLLEHHDLSCDVLVAGGGPAGVPCAIAAARSGATVILCQDRSVLGGNASSEVRMHIVGADCSGGRGIEGLTEAREGGIIDEIRTELSVRNPQRCANMLDLVLYEMCRAEPNLTLMLNTTVTGAELADGRIVAARAERQSTEDAFRIEAKVFIDCTGDGRLGAEAGAACLRGREGKVDYNETLAQNERDRKSLGSTLLFTATKHDRPMPFVAPPWVRKFTEDDLKLRPHAGPNVDGDKEYGYWWIEWGGQLDTIKDNETIRDELLAIMLGVWDHVKNGPPGTPPGEDPHGASHWALNWFGFLPGKRESRRFIGMHVLTEHDVMGSRPQPDAIAFGGWPIDTHPPEGVDRPDEKPCDQNHVPHLYDIPLSCCIARDVPNLMFAGRNISATHVGFASTRVMATCAVVGQGVGTAAAHAVRHQRQPAELPKDDAAMRSIQQQLLRDDCYLIGVRNEDEDDLARQARVTASSAQPGAGPEQVLSGQTRSVHGDGGAPPDRAYPGVHRWKSDPAVSLPAWIELAWDQPHDIGRVQLIFDTGLHRALTLSQSAGYQRRMKWGEPQPETVADFRVEGRIDGAWRTLQELAGNHRRRVILAWAPTLLDGLRVVVTATNGVDHARICEIRAYPA